MHSFECSKIFDFICFYNSYSEIESPSNPIARDFKEMLKLSACLLINGRYALRSLRYPTLYRNIVKFFKFFLVKIINYRYNMNDFKIFSYKEDSACEVNLVCDQIRDLKNALDK